MHLLCYQPRVEHPEQAAVDLYPSHVQTLRKVKSLETQLKALRQARGAVTCPNFHHWILGTSVAVNGCRAKPYAAMKSLVSPDERGMVLIASEKTLE